MSNEPDDVTQHFHVPDFDGTLTDREAALMANPEMVEAIRKGVEQAKAGETTTFVAHEDDTPFTNIVFDFDADRVLTQEQYDQITEAVIDVVFGFRIEGETVFEVGSAHRRDLTWDEREEEWNAEIEKKDDDA